MPGIRDESTLEDSRPPVSLLNMNGAWIAEWNLPFSFLSCSGWRRVFLSALSFTIPHSCPAGQLLWEISLQFLCLLLTCLYIFFQISKWKRYCCGQGFVSKPGKSLTPLWLHFLAALTPKNMSKGFTDPSSFSGPTKALMLSRRGVTYSMKDLREHPRSFLTVTLRVTLCSAFKLFPIHIPKGPKTLKPRFSVSIPLLFSLALVQLKWNDSQGSWSSKPLNSLALLRH